MGREVLTRRLKRLALEDLPDDPEEAGAAPERFEIRSIPDCAGGEGVPVAGQGVVALDEIALVALASQGHLHIGAVPGDTDPGRSACPGEGVGETRLTPFQG